MGGSTQSKLAFINPAMKKKGDDAANKANKTAVVVEDVKPQVHMYFELVKLIFVKNCANVKEGFSLLNRTFL